MGRKGQQHPSMGGVFTRGRSEIFLHRTRSGLARRGPTPRRPFPGDIRVSPLAVAGGVAPGSSVKDLRARRIFSPSSIPIEISPDKACKVEADADPPPPVDPIQFVIDIPVPFSVPEPECTVKLPTSTVKVNGSDADAKYSPVSDQQPQPSPQLPTGTGIKSKLGILPCSRLKLFGNSNSLNYKRLLPYLMEHANDGGVEIIQTSKKEHLIDGKLSSPAVNTLPRQDSDPPLASGNLESPTYKPIILKPMKAFNSETSIALPGTMTNSKAQIALTNSCNQPPLQVHGDSSMGLFPCSRLKLISDPASLNYKRLLPFLMDLQKDVLLSSQNDPVKVKENMEEKSSSKNQDRSACKESVTSFAAAPNASLNAVASPIHETQFHETMASQTQSEVSALSCPNDIYKTPQRDSLNACKIPALELAILNSVEDDPTGSKLMATPPATSSDCAQQATEKALRVCPEVDEVETELKCYSTFSVPSPTLAGALSVEELAGNAESPLYPCSKDEINRRKIARSLYEDTNTLEGTPPYQRIRTVEEHDLAPKKSILKKTIRGCKGLCTCLNCSTFRIHAEKSFDFSRKQLLEADEVVNGLVKELSTLRDLLNSRALTPSGAESSTQVNHKVKRLCQRSSRVEELAKDRLKQMFDDLNCHSRSPGPRVAFADCVEERVIPSSWA